MSQSNMALFPRISKKMHLKLICFITKKNCNITQKER